MLNVRYVLRLFADSITRSDIAGTVSRRCSSIRLLGSQPRYEAGPVYLAGTGMVPPPDAVAEKGALLVFCDGMDAIAPKGASIICIDKPLADVYNTLESILSEGMRWRADFEQLPRSAGIQPLISLAAKHGDCTAVLMTDHGDIIASDSLRKSALFSDPHKASKPAIKRGIREILQAIEAKGGSARFKTTTGGTLCGKRIVHPDGLVSFLLLESAITPPRMTSRRSATLPPKSLATG